MIRYSDVFLTYAEAQGELKNFDVANTYLNKVRNRANLPNASVSTVENLREAVLNERRKEFVAEGQRWFDLVRTGTLAEKVMEAKGIAVKPIYNLFPIPQRERDLNPNLPQNTGY